MIGKTLLHYTILDKLGEGGMGVVYKARDNKLKREVAIKFLPSSISSNEEERERFKIEAQAAAALNHQNISHIYAIEEAENEIFIAMELINGIELKDKIKSGNISENEIFSITKQIAEGLETAHKNGIVHRDIKSSNIMITEEGKIKIMDFGLAKIGEGSDVTRIGSTVGTVAYMSPEQTNGKEVDQRTDIWSFGIVLYEMLTGDLPFWGAYDQAIIYSILNEEPEELGEIENRELFQEIINNTLKKKCEERYSQIREILDDLENGNLENNSSVKNVIPDIKKLAILPFSNIMEDSESNFLGFALADQIIGSMAYSKHVLVRPSSSIRKFQNEVFDIRVAGDELNVNFILAGNYLRAGDTIRLNVELVDLDSDNMIWRESIELKYKNVFEVQDIVAQKVVDGLHVQFSNEERERMKPDTPQNPAAYEFYLRAISYPYTIEGNKIALEMLNSSIKLDPGFAPVHFELGSRYNQISQVGTSTVVAQDKAEKAMLKALELKEDFLPALANLGLIYTDAGRHEESHEMLMRAVKINPNNAWLHFSLSYHYRYIGFLEESKKEFEVALSIDPGNPRFRSSIITLMYLGKYDEILKTFQLDLEGPFTLNYLGEVAFRNGNKDLAMEYFKTVLTIKDEIGEYYFASSFIEYINGNIEKAKNLTLQRELENPADSEIFYEIARIYGLLGFPEDCCRALRKSIDRGYASYPAMQNDVFFDSVRSYSEISQLFSKAKKEHYELKTKLSTIY